jgi:hypothetical protein
MNPQIPLTCGERNRIMAQILLVTALAKKTR